MISLSLNIFCERQNLNEPRCTSTNKIFFFFQNQNYFKRLFQLGDCFKTNSKLNFKIVLLIFKNVFQLFFERSKLFQKFVSNVWFFKNYFKHSFQLSDRFKTISKCVSKNVSFKNYFKNTFFKKLLFKNGFKNCFKRVIV